MKSFYIVTNKTKDPNGTYTAKIAEYLTGKSASCVCASNCADADNIGYLYTDKDNVPSDTECIVVLGGDGTLIQAARDLNDLNIPILGINIGMLGYLTDTEFDKAFATLDKLLCDEYDVDCRMMLDGCIIRDDEVIFSDTALNDVVINRTGILRILDFDIFVNGEYLNSYMADGVIISTATGSTAYSLSAGGPIIQPNASLIMITPVCPHTMNQRSIIFGSDDEVTIQIKEKKKNASDRVATFDGESFCNLTTGDKIVIRRSERVSRFIKTSKMSFLERIRNKM